MTAGPGMGRRAALGAIGASVVARQARAQGLGGPATVVVPYLPGVAERELRALTSMLSAKLGRPVGVDNLPGAGGATGARAVAAARPDGRTLLYAAASVLTILPLLPNAAPGLDDLVPVARATSGTFVLATRAEAPYRDLGALIAQARANPDRLVFASAGTGTAVHLAGEAMAEAAGISFRHAAFQGVAPAIAAVLAGQADVVIGLPVAIMQAVRDGRLRGLAQFGAERSPFAPEVPTLRQSGLDLVQELDSGFFAPRGLPPAIFNAWVEAVRDGVAQVEFQAHAVRTQVGAAFLPPAAFARVIERDRELNRRLIARLAFG